MNLEPCLDCGAEFKNGKGWRHSQECPNYDPPRETTFEEFAEMFGDLDPALFV